MDFSALTSRAEHLSSGVHDKRSSPCMKVNLIAAIFPPRFDFPFVSLLHGRRLFVFFVCFRHVHFHGVYAATLRRGMCFPLDFVVKEENSSCGAREAAWKKSRPRRKTAARSGKTRYRIFSVHNTRGMNSRRRFGPRTRTNKYLMRA